MEGAGSMSASCELRWMDCVESRSLQSQLRGESGKPLARFDDPDRFSRCPRLSAVFAEIGDCGHAWLLRVWEYACRVALATAHIDR